MSYTLIERKELTETASSISFDNIPQFYTDVVLLISARSNASGLRDLYMSLNGSTASFTGRNLDGNGGTAASATLTRYVGTVNGTPQTANTFGNISIYIPNYAGVTNKSFSVDGVTETNGTTAIQTIGAGLWSSTAPITSVAFSPSTDSLVAGTTASLYGINRQQAIGRSPQALGGVIAQANGYWYHVFNGSGDFKPFNNLEVEYLVIAGGGGSGGGTSGGGGAGGYRSSVISEPSGGGASAESRLSLTGATNYPVVVGAGGSAGTSDGANGGQGTNSTFSTITSTGGGGGIHSGNGFSGGSGGGAGYASTSFTGGAGATGQGFAGGNVTIATNSTGTSAGGGGAGAVGGNVTNVNIGGSGGNGVQSSITGTLTFRAGGGAGGNNSGTIEGGLGGGGSSINEQNGTPGTANTGGGAGSPGTNGARIGGAGGSGIVIIRYKA
jgi:hypothetical protein